jgi:hypothetical protein
MGVREKVWSALTSMMKLEGKVQSQTDAMKDQQFKIEKLTERVIRMEAQMDAQMEAAVRTPGGKRTHHKHD